MNENGTESTRCAILIFLVLTIALRRPSSAWAAASLAVAMKAKAASAYTIRNIDDLPKKIRLPNLSILVLPLAGPWQSHDRKRNGLQRKRRAGARRFLG